MNTLDKNEDKFKSLIQYLEESFALGKLDNALIILSSITSIAFTIGNAAFGREIIPYILPLFFFGWMMPIWSGYFLGAVIRKNLTDRIRGWIYLLSGTSSYLISPFIGLYLPLGSFYQLDPLSLPKSLLLFSFAHSVIVLVTVIFSLELIQRLFKTIPKSMPKTVIPIRPLLFTSIAIALFTGSMSGFHIWSLFGTSSQLILAVTIAFLMGFLFEYLATYSTKKEFKD
jgi:hypothetical protein